MPSRARRADVAFDPAYVEKLTGLAVSPEDTKRTASHIIGAEVTIMRELGHFPMSENPAKFREYILPVLAKIWLCRMALPVPEATSTPAPMLS